jgi:integrase/recombinase XerD
VKSIIVKRNPDLRQLTLTFAYDDEIISIIRTIKDARWSSTLKCWLVPDESDMVSELFNLLRGKAFLDYSSLKTEKTVKRKEDVELPSLPELTNEDKRDIEEFRRWLVHKRYSESTIKTYIGMLSQLLRFMHPKKCRDIDEIDMVNFVNEYIIPRKLSYTFQNQVISSAKLFFRNIIKVELEVENFERPRRYHKLPNVLSRQEVKMIIDAPVNMKHRVMLSLIYACGLRRSELLNLVPRDIDASRGVLIIRQSKGKKDRIVPISQKLITILREYYKHYKPEIYLFEGQQRGSQYSATSLMKILGEACNKSGIQKPVTLHWLRHSYATHLLESGTDLRYIQELLGHSSSRTTEIYTHVSIKNIQNIKSPFDEL